MKQRYRRARSTVLIQGVATHVHIHEVQLSIKERMIVRMLILGERRKQIAEALKILPSTVTTHIARISGPLHFYSLAQLTRWVITHPKSLAGQWSSPQLHPSDCPCRAQFCRALRYSRALGEPLVVIPFHGAPLIIMAPHGPLKGGK